MNYWTYILIVLTSLSCTKDKAFQTVLIDCNVVNANYTDDVVPIVQASCMTGTGPGTGCHDAWITDYNELKQQVDNGNIIRVQIIQIFIFTVVPCTIFQNHHVSIKPFM